MNQARSPRTIRVAIAGVGNCASSLVQGVWYYRKDVTAPGLITRNVGPFGAGDITFVAAFDVDSRKVGQPLSRAIFSPPNCAFQPSDNSIAGGDDPVVSLGPILDGVAPHTQHYPEEDRIVPASGACVDIVRALRESRTEVLVCYLPVGSEQAVRFYAEACLKANVGFVNCVPVFIASNPTMASKFAAAGVPLVGDDIRSQVGATIMHQRIVDLLTERGYVINSTYQLNVGGNSDFLNMLDRDRLSSKKLSKLNAVKSHLPGNVAAVATHVGPSDYVRQLDDKKVAYIHVEGTGFTGARLSLELRLQVEDSPNSAAAVLDVIRYAALARLRGQGGAILPASSYYMKSPPVRMEDPIALRQLRDFGATALLEAGATVQCPVVPTE